jgi:molecular chaperone Hsp33
MAEGDRIVRCLIEDSRARVVVAVTTGTVREIAGRHGARGPAAVALGRAATAGVLLATLTKDEEQVTLQVLGDGPLGGVTVDARSSGSVRAYLKHPDAATPAEPGASPRLSLAAAIGGEGMVNVIRDLGLSSNFSGQTGLQTGAIDEDVEHYLQTSEQIDSVLRCDTILDARGEVQASAGLLVQTLPQAGGTALVELIRDRVRGAVLAEALAGDAGPGGPRPEGLARAVLGPCAESLQAIDSRAVRFRCPCSRERAVSVLAMLGEADLRELIRDDKQASVVCKFCGGKYEFSDEELRRIRHGRAVQRAN